MYLGGDKIHAGGNSTVNGLHRPKRPLDVFFHLFRLKRSKIVLRFPQDHQNSDFEFPVHLNETNHEQSWDIGLGAKTWYRSYYKNSTESCLF